MLPMIDIGMGFYYRTQVMTAAQAGAQWAFVYGWQDKNSDAQPNIASAITSATSLPIEPTNYAMSLQCGCVNGKTIKLLSTPLGSFRPAQCLKESCPPGYDPQAGAFVTVTVHDVNYTPLFPGFSFGQRSGGDGSVLLSARSTVRIQ